MLLYRAEPPITNHAYWLGWVGIQRQKSLELQKTATIEESQNQAPTNSWMEAPFKGAWNPLIFICIHKLYHFFDEMALS